MSDQSQSFWIVVGSPDNFEKTREHNFTIQGMKSRQRKKAAQMQPGDEIIYYITGKKAFGGIATITSEAFEDSTIIWSSNNKKRDDEVYPHRVNIEPDIILDNDNFLEAEEPALQTKYVQKWPAKNWTLAFQGNVHKIEEADYQLLREAIEQHASARARS
jgi:predicted RNA-binding protein